MTWTPRRTGSGRAGRVSGSGSISPGLKRRTSSSCFSPPPNSLSASSNSRSYRSKHWAAVLPTRGAMVRHWHGYNFAKCSNFSSSSRVHSVFLIEGSSHSYQRALHCFADFLLSKEATRAHWFLPYFMTAAFKISSSVFFQTPPLIMMRILAYGRRGPRAPGSTACAVCGEARRRVGRRGGWRRAGAAVCRCAAAGEAGAPPRCCSAAGRGASAGARAALRGRQRLRERLCEHCGSLRRSHRGGQVDACFR